MEGSMVFKMLDRDVKMYSYDDLKLNDAPPKRLMCGLCGNIMVNPIQTFRGEIACKTCYDEKRGYSNICPLDGKVIESYPIYFQDNAIKMEIEQLVCYCQKDECSWQGQLYEAKHHLEQFKHSSMHNQSIQHGNSFDKHFATIETRMEEKKCIYDNCAFKPKNSRDLKRHLRDEVISHACLHASAMNQLKNDFKTSALELEETMSYKTAKMESEIQHLKTQMRLLFNFTIEMNMMTRQD